MSGPKVFQALAGALVESRLGVMFGLVGDANLYLVDSFVRDHGGSFVGAASENSAALMAIGYASVSGTVGIVSVTHGPAVTNTLTALIEGVKSFTPTVLLCGDTDPADRDNVQDVPQRELIVATGAGFEQMRSPVTAVADLARAVQRACLERRPIAFNIPTSLQHEVIHNDFRQRVIPISQPRLTPFGDDLDNAVGILAAARRPIVLAGRGAVDEVSRAALVRLARRLDAPLATTLKAKGLFRGERGDIGIFGTLSTPAAVETIMRSDCVISFGASLTGYTTAHGAYLRGKRVVQVSAHAADLGRWHVPDIRLVGGVAETVDAINHWLDAAEIAPSGFLSERPDAVSETIPDSDPRPDASIDYADTLRRLNAMLPAERMLVMDYGRFMVRALQLIDVPHPRYMVHTGNSGSIGMGMSYAVGAAMTDPARPVVLMVGDGGFMLGGLAEFNAAVRHGVDLVVIVCNDSSYGVEHMQLRAKRMDPALVTFDWPDFAPLAAALGGAGVTVRTSADLETAREAIKTRDRPLLIDLKLHPDQVPVE